MSEEEFLKLWEEAQKRGEEEGHRRVNERMFEELVSVMAQACGCPKRVARQALLNVFGGVSPPSRDTIMLGYTAAALLIGIGYGADRTLSLLLRGRLNVADPKVRTAVLTLIELSRGSAIAGGALWVFTLYLDLTHYQGRVLIEWLQWLGVPRF